MTSKKYFLIGLLNLIPFKWKDFKIELEVSKLIFGYSWFENLKTFYFINLKKVNIPISNLKEFLYLFLHFQCSLASGDGGNYAVNKKCF